MSQRKTDHFDKFIKDICKREDASRKKIEEYVEGQDELPQRKYNRLYRERWQNSIKYKRVEK
tara:strand:+ start:129 stop:314 length:186 start_codon:yes stop_codon:yes gene_type:complete